jgi:hypothetical protein
MLAYEFLRWWYGPGWVGIGQNLKRRLGALSETFSVGILLRTLFAPWRRIVTYPGAGIGAHLRAMGDNLVSRFIGFLVRLTVLIAAAASSAVLLLLGALQLAAWPVLPVAALGLLVWGLL